MSLHQALQDRLSAIEAQLPVLAPRPALPRRPMALRHDAADRVSPVLQQLLAEVLPGALVLDWRQEGAGHAGRMAADGLVYRFRVDAEGVGYRPAWEGVLQRGWELRSDSFLQLRAPAARMDFRRTRAGTGQNRKCTTGYGCGSACISLQKECRISPRSAIGKGRLRRLQQLAAAGNQSAGATASQVQASRGAAAAALQKDRTTQRVQKLLERLKSSAGPISSALNRAADRVEAGEAEATVRKELERDVFAAVEEELVSVGLRKLRKDTDTLEARLDALRRKCSTDSFWQRIDAMKRRCATGYSCGSSCISMSKQCRKTPGAGPGQQKMQRILALAAPGNATPAKSPSPAVAPSPRQTARRTPKTDPENLLDMQKRGQESRARIAKIRSTDEQAIAREAKKLGLSDAHLGALSNYTADDKYADINHYMRTGKAKTQYDQNFNESRDSAAMLKDALTKLPEYRGDTFRGIAIPTADAERMFKVGGVFRDKAFQSTSRDETVAKHFAAGGVTSSKITAVIITYKAGHGGRDVSKLSERANEQEVIVGPPAKFRVLSVTPGPKGKGLQVTVERI